MVAAPPRTQIPLPSQTGGKQPDLNAELSVVPIHIVTDVSQLPSDFLEPSAERQLIIGFDGEGVDLRRYGTLCIMQLAFPDAVYLVDAIQGGKALMQACKSALESSYITKVVHDCKRDSEAPYFQFGIKLNSVVDTQIAYSLIEEQEGTKRSLDDYISFVASLLTFQRWDPLIRSHFFYLASFPFKQKEKAKRIEWVAMHQTLATKICCPLPAVSKIRDEWSPQSTKKKKSNEKIFDDGPPFRKSTAAIQKEISDRKLDLPLSHCRLLPSR